MITYTCTCRRQPVTSRRPTFREIVIALTANPSEVLFIPEEALATHHLAGVLASPLVAGERMYQDLQNKYHDVSNDETTPANDYEEI